MRSNLTNSWLDLMLGQIWMTWQASGAIARCIDQELRIEPYKRTDRRLEPVTPRLNPLEFHGKRRTAVRPVRRN